MSSSTFEGMALQAFAIAGTAGMKIQRSEILVMLRERLLQKKGSLVLSGDRYIHRALVEQLEQIIQLVEAMPCDPTAFLDSTTDTPE